MIEGFVLTLSFILVGP